MRGRQLLCLLIGLVVFAMPTLAGSLTATIVMPQGSNAGKVSFDVGANDLKPDECDTLDLEEVLAGSGEVIGTDASELISTHGSDDIIDGGLGDDCILSGEGSDKIEGGDGYDVCVGIAATEFGESCEVRYPEAP